jgi:hypothetical protein
MEQINCLQHERDKKYTESDFLNKLKWLNYLADFGVDGKAKVNQSRYRPGVAQRVQGS